MHLFVQTNHAVYTVDLYMKTNGVFTLQESVTLPYLSGLIWINLD